jgi:hypothetical protein
MSVELDEGIETRASSGPVVLIPEEFFFKFIVN